MHNTLFWLSNRSLALYNETGTSYFVDVDECANGTDGCAQTCTNSEGSYTCSCDSGYTLLTDNLNCEGKKILQSEISRSTTLIIIDIDECATNNGGCAQICTNTNPSFVCSCDMRHILAADNLTCEGNNYSVKRVL